MSEISLAAIAEKPFLDSAREDFPDQGDSYDNRPQQTNEVIKTIFCRQNQVEGNYRLEHQSDRRQVLFDNDKKLFYVHQSNKAKVVDELASVIYQALEKILKVLDHFAATRRLFNMQATAAESIRDTEERIALRDLAKDSILQIKRFVSPVLEPLMQKIRKEPTTQSNCKDFLQKLLEALRLQSFHSRTVGALLADNETSALETIEQIYNTNLDEHWYSS